MGVVLKYLVLPIKKAPTSTVPAEVRQALDAASAERIAPSAGPLFEQEVSNG